jgi:hypothetical protein
LSGDSVAVEALGEMDLSPRLSVPAGWYMVRAYISGRDDLLRWSANWDGGPAPVGLERFVVQLWPR